MSRLHAHPQSSQTFLPYNGGETIGRGRLRTTSAMNLSIAAERSPQTKQLPLKTTSFQVGRGGFSESLLPDYNEKVSESKSHNHSNLRKPMTYRASEKGSGGILPLASPMGGYATDSVWNRARRSTAPLECIMDMTQRLRSRRRTTSTGELMSQLDNSTHLSDHNGRHLHHKWSTSEYSQTSSKHRKRSSLVGMNHLKHIRKRDWFQILIICVVSFLVVESYRKAVSTTERLEQFKEDESMMMLHLQRIEQQSIHLHENLSRLGDMSGRIVASDTTQHAGDIPAKNDGVDSNLIRVQTQQLYQMEEELDHELRALQAKLQHVARSSIINAYGDGPVKVVLDLDFPEGTPEAGNNAISILLWYDTPHAAWTWLEQIRKGEWNGSSFKIGKSASIDASPVISNAGTLDFVEKSQKSHDAWTVGLTDIEGNLAMFINLQDNADVRKHEVCVGKIIDGFDALKRLVDVTRSDTRRPVGIHRASATHLSRNQKPP